MTISTTTRSAGPFLGAGAVIAAPFSFKVFSTSDLSAYKTSSGVNVTLVLDVDYTVALNADQDATPGGTVTTSTVVASGTSVYLTSQVAETQGTALPNGGPWFASVVEAALDRLTILVQQIRLGVSRSIRAPFPEILSELPGAAARANTTLGFDSLGNPTVLTPVSGSATDVLISLASTATPGGASRVGVYDGGSYYTATTVEGALAEAGAYLSHIRTQKPAAYSLPRFFRALQQYRHDLQLPVYIVGFGSSVGVGATLPAPTTQAPVNYFKIKLKATLDAGNLYNLQVSNDSVNGSALSQVSTALAAAVTAGHTPKLCVLAYGMNDAAVALYNNGQTFPFVYTNIMQHVKEARALGADVILMTTPHHNTSYGSTLYTMPAGIPQTYPTSVAANVLPEQLLPPASASNITADFIGTGTSITVSHRHLRVNQAMRQAATDAGVPLIDVEPYWFKAIATYGEAALFDSGETVHPNLLGHQQSYWKAIDEFIEAMCRQTAQEGQEPRLNGLVGLNTDLPAAVLDVRPPYPDTTSPILQARARIGAPDGNGIKADCTAWRVESATGDLVGLSANTATNAEIEAFRRHITVDGTGTIAAYTEDRATVGSIGSTFSRFTSVTYNVGIGATSPAFSVPNNSAGTLWITGYCSSLGRRRTRVEWVCKAGVITFGTAESVGDVVFTGPTAAGLVVSVSVAAANTNIGWEMQVAQGL